MAPKNVDDIYPLTPMQQLMLLHELTADGRGVLANQICFDLEGRLDVVALDAAAQRLAARHPALRTGFLWKGVERPLQVVRSTVRVPVTVVDLTDRAEGARSAEAEALRARDEAEPFDVARAPLVRFLLVRLGAEHHRLVWTVHHLVADRWSFDRILRELGILYGALAGGGAPALDAPVPFRNYVAWLQEQDPGASRAHWREVLAGLDGATLLAPSPSAATRGRDPRRLTTRRVVSEAETARLDAAAGAWRVSRAVPILAGLAVEVGRRTGRRDATIGLTVSGRPPELPGVDEIVGSFVNNVPARFRLDPERAVSEWIGEIRRAQLARLPHEHTSLDDVQAAAATVAGPLFDLLVVTNLDSGVAPGWPGLRLRPLRATLAAGFPLVLQASREGARLVFTLVHPPEFDAEGLLEGVASACVALADAEAGACLGAVVDVPPSPAGGPPGPKSSEGIDADASPLEPAGDVGARVRRAWCEVLGVERARIGDDFFDLGGTSLQGARFLARLEEELERPVPMAALAGGRTLGAILEAVGAPRSERAGPLVVLRSGGARTPVVAVPGARGNLLLFTRLADHLAPDRTLYGLQSRGVDADEERFTRMADIADDFIAQLEPLGDAPFHLFGICWGAAAAVEMAARLTALGRPPRSLSLLDPASLEERRVGAGPINVAGRLGFILNRTHLYGRELAAAGWPQRRRLLLDKGRALLRFIRSREVEPTTRQELRAAAVLESNLEALNHFDPPVTEVATRLFLSADFDVEGDADPRLAWLDRIRRCRGIVRVPGWDAASVTLHHSPELAALLDDWFDEVDAEDPRSERTPAP